MPGTTHDNDARTLGELFADLSRQFRTLLQQELQLAKTELTQKAAAVTMAVSLILGGGLLAYAGFLAVVAAAILGLIALGLPPWGAAMLGGLLVVGAGSLLVRAGLQTLKAQTLMPEATIDTMKENAQWLKAQTK
jgi:hypothetical protein